MLAALAIRDIVLIDRLDVEFDDGLTVLTGETGAGKSILLDSLSLALGGRADSGLVRAGADHGTVSAVFDLAPGHAVKALLDAHDIPAEDGLMLKRTQSADGRTRAFINDEPVSVGLLRQVGSTLIEIHGQHDDRALIDAAGHRGLIDAYGGLEGPVTEVADAFRTWRRERARLEDERARIDAARREQDYLRASVDELIALDPQPGEEADLADRRQAMMQAEKIADDLNDAAETVGGQASPIPVLASLLRRLERKVQGLESVLSEPVNALARALDALEEARAGLDDAVREIDFDQTILEQSEERLFALRAAARKHGVAPDDLAELRDTMAQDLADIDAGEAALAALKDAVDGHRALFEAKARALSAMRHTTAKALEEAVHEELPALKLDRATFSVRIDSDEATPREEGFDAVEFWVQTNPGTKPGPMMKVASGGELSRFLLALKVALADMGSAPTLIFDEIDTGVGGAVAEAIGVRLARLADTVQVLSVTHAPQVAARAGRHLVISKDADGAKQVFTRLNDVAAEARREEIARMLAGAKITDEARAAAERLIRGVAG